MRSGGRGVQPVRAAEHPYHREQGIDLSCRNADCVADFSDDRDQLVDFQRPAGFGILQHRGLEFSHVLRELYLLVGGHQVGTGLSGSTVGLGAE